MRVDGFRVERRIRPSSVDSHEELLILPQNFLRGLIGFATHVDHVHLHMVDDEGDDDDCDEDDEVVMGLGAGGRMIVIVTTTAVVVQRVLMMMIMMVTMVMIWL